MPDIEKLEAKFKTRKQNKLIENQTNLYVHELQRSLYPHLEENVNVNRKGKLGGSLSSSKEISKESMGDSRKEKHLAPGQLVLCKAEAENLVLQKIDYGLGCIKPEDYFKLN